MFVDLQAEFRDYPPLLRHAVSIGRRIQDPLIEFAGLCDGEGEIECLKLHPLQVIYPFKLVNITSRPF